MVQAGLALNDEGMTKPEMIKRNTGRPSSFEHLGFLRHSSFVFASATHSLCVCAQQACSRRSHGIAPSNKQGSRFWGYQRSPRAILVSQSWRRCHPLQRRPSFHHAMVARPDDNQPQWWLGQNRTRPTLLPFAFVLALAPARSEERRVGTECRFGL